jgi:hypothetical protein
MRARSFRPSPAMVVAVIALIVAMSGTSWALVRNSVGTAELKNGAVTAPKMHKDAIKSTYVKDGSLQRQDFAAGLLPPAGVTVQSDLTDFRLAPTSPVTIEATLAYTVPADKTLLLSNVVFQNPASDVGRLELRRSGATLMQLNLTKFSTQDQHFDSPITFPAGTKVELFIHCDNPSGGCTPSALFAGVLTE